MLKRSLQASEEGMSKAKAALISRSLTQAGLAAELEISRQPVSKFFQGKAVERYIFVEICNRLNLKWDEIATFSSLPDAEQTASISQKLLVQKVREKIHDSIQRRCGTIRVLDMEQPMRLDAIYTSVNILERVTGHRRLSITKLPDCISIPHQKRVSALAVVERYDRLMILGKPGSGKTIFLKWLAILCNLGQFQADRVPIFITLKDFAQTSCQPSLLDYITEQFEECGVVEPQAAQKLLSQGQAIVLLDGLDEIREAHLDRVLQEIRSFSTRFYSSSFVVTCRIAAQEYTFEQFTEVEIADFGDQEIANFAAKWFQVKDPIKAESFLQRLQENQPIKELATHPLLLTLLCLIFEEMADFPANRSELYQEGLDILLKKWDAKRNIERNPVYKQSLCTQDLLCQIAWTTFVAGEYFFKQKAIEQQITEYIRNLPDAKTILDSFAILKSIEAQHGLLVEQARGIYSFSHITFHEYFAAKKIVSSPPAQAEAAFQDLVCHITEKRWREVFLLTVEMLPNADHLLQLMKRQIDSLLASDKQQYDDANMLLVDCLKVRLLPHAGSTT